MKDDKHKVDISLLPPKALYAIARVMEYGAKKYSRNNWREDKDTSFCRTYSSIQRHLMSWVDGEDKDPETNESHVAHAAAQCLMLLIHEVEQPHNDDRYKERKIDKHMSSRK